MLFYTHRKSNTKNKLKFDQTEFLLKKLIQIDFTNYITYETRSKQNAQDLDMYSQL